ncbi:MAG: hypothetical protein AAF215_30495 [Cyanobacteria bacterium P01_A01_bin.123]
MNRAENNDRSKILKELRHQMRYANTLDERESIRKTLAFWQRRY